MPTDRPDSPTSSAEANPADPGASAGEGFGAGVAEALVSLAIAAHRHATYPREHPSLRDSLEVAVKELGRVLVDRGSLAISVREGGLVTAAPLPEESHALLSDLARRIEEHQLGALIVRRGVTIDEMRGVLDALSRDPHHSEARLGLLPVHERPVWEHVLLQPVGYEYLHPSDRIETRAGRSLVEIWDDLESLGGPLGGDGSGVGSVEDDAADDASAFVGTLTRLLDELGWERGEGASRVRAEFESWVHRVSPAALASWFRLADGPGDGLPGEGSSADPGPRPLPSARLLVALSRSEVSLSIVARLTRILSYVSTSPVSPGLADSLDRVAGLAESLPAPAAEGEGLAAARAILDRVVIETSSGRNGVAPGRWAGPAGSERPSPSRETGLSRESALRVVEMCVAVDRGGAAFQRALGALVRSADVQEVIELAEAAPSDSRAAREIEEFLMTPDQLRTLLSGDDVDDASLAAMVNRLGDRAMDPLFDRLAGSESRTIRRKIFDCLTAMGERVSGTVMSYLEDPPWFVQRNMLALLQRMPSLPQGFSPLQHLGHEDARVRREALPLALRVPGAREEALRTALADPDERMVRMALLELQEGVPPSVLPVLVEKGLREPRFPELGSLAARALVGSKDPEARDALLERCLDAEGLAPRDPTLLSALVALATGWRDDPQVKPVLRMARDSDDPRVVAALDRVTSRRGRRS